MGSVDKGDITRLRSVGVGVLEYLQSHVMGQGFGRIATKAHLPRFASVGRCQYLIICEKISATQLPNEICNNTYLKCTDSESGHVIRVRLERKPHVRLFFFWLGQAVNTYRYRHG